MLNLTVVTPQRAFLKDECISVTLPGKLGELQVLEGHAACLAELSAGIISFQKKDKEIVHFMIGSGFLEVDQDNVNILCEQARYKSEVDKSKEENLLLELKEKLNELPVKSDDEQKRLFALLDQCVARLRLFE